MRKKKILVIGYGGTISMVVKGNKVVPAENIEEIMSLLPSLSELADVELDVLSNKDSTNVNHADWSRIAYRIGEKMDEYDGFLITHGTNTMAYIASALSLALGRGLTKPVALTGSQLPLTVYGNDARFNFENSIKVIVQACEENIAEVMIVFDDLVLRGGRAVKVSESAFRAFLSPAFPSIVDITSTGVHFNYHALKKEEGVPFEMKPHFTPGILSIDLTPGQLPDLFEAILSSGKCKGIILKSHGAGSVPTEGSYNFIPLIEKTVHQYKIPVIISTKFLGGNSFKEVNDECAVLALEAGAIPSGDLGSTSAIPPARDPGRLPQGRGARAKACPLRHGEAAATTALGQPDGSRRVASRASDRGVAPRSRGITTASSSRLALLRAGRQRGRRHCRGGSCDVMTEVKLMWILSQGINGVNDIRKSILSEYAGEITGKKVKSLTSS